MFGLTTLGLFHTAVGLVALVSGFAALARYKVISADNRLGQVYLISTLVTALSALGIFQHGGFGPPHALAIMTLIALAVGSLAARSQVFGRASRYIQAICYTATILFHMIPGVTESLTRLPLGAPVEASADAPIFQTLYPILAVITLIIMGLQIGWLRRQSPAGNGAGKPA